ncbi:hypothetical protein [Streptomyces chattanoogensis]|uniref:hypothetical protein n=1 Tax=Streptomyces chattanoogensis TaxID=66876 RepID=UPI0036D0514D
MNACTPLGDDGLGALEGAEVQAVLHELALTAPKVLGFVFLLLLVIIPITLRIALRDVASRDRAEIIRALADLLAFWRSRK